MLKFLMSHRRLAVLVVVLPAATVLVAHPTLASSLGVDVWNMAELRQELRELTAHHDRLEADDQEIRRRIEVKEAIIAELIAGNTTLPEVTSQFLALDSNRPASMNTIRDTFPGSTDEEKMARNIIQYALYRVPTDQRGEVGSRLEAELQQMLSNDADASE